MAQRCHRRSTLSYLAYKCHSIFICEFSTWPSDAIDGQLSLDWRRSAIAPRNIAPSLTRICRIQWCCSLFLVFEWKYPFWPNLGQKIKTISLSWNLVPTLIRISRIRRWCLLFLFFIWNTLFGKFGSKSQNYQFKLKFGTCTNSNMQNSIAVFTFFVSNQKCLLWENLVQNVKIIGLRLNLLASLIRLCRIQRRC